MTSVSAHRQMWRLAAPMIFANIAVPLLGVVDTAIVGHLPEPKYLAAIAVGSLVFSMFYWVLGFLRMGTTGLAAQSLGSLERGGDAQALAAVLGRAGFLGLALGLALVLLQWPLSLVVFPLMGAEDAVLDGARRYYQIRIWGAPAALLQFALLGWLLGTQHVKSALAVQIFLNLLNAALDALFVYVFHMDVDGVALGTLISEYAAVVLSAALVRRALHRSYGVSILPVLTKPVLFAREPLRQLLKINGNIFLRTVCLMVAFFMFTSIGGRLGTVTLAANTVLMNFYMFMAFGLDGFAFAAEAMVGADKGAANHARFRTSVRVTSTWALAAAIIFSLMYLIAGEAIIALLTDLPDVRATANAYLGWIAVTPLLAVASFQLDGIFVGLTRTREMRDTMAAALAVYLIALAVLLPPFGNHGLWASQSLFLLARSAFMAWSFRRRSDVFAT